MSEIDPRIVSAVDHVQRAALEMIAAMRNALDVAEDLVGDPGALQSLMQGMVIVAKSTVDNVTTMTDRSDHPSAGEPDTHTAERVTRIRVD